MASISRISRIGSAVTLLAAVSALLVASGSTWSDPSDVRITLSFNHGWSFARDLPLGPEYHSPDFNDQAWQKVTLPHTPRVEPLVVNDQWRGDAWYRKTFSLDESHSGRKVFVRFEGAMQKADVWLNGEHLGTHTGGYLPFAFDLSGDILFGADNMLAVKLNNEDDASVPPGKELSVLDFNYFGGIYRNVALILTEDLHITDPILADVVGGGGLRVYTTDVSRQEATLNINVHVRNDGETTQRAAVRNTLQNPDGVVQLSETTETVDIEPGADHTFQVSYPVSDPLLWSPQHPNLYELTTELTRSSDVADIVATRIGIRDFRIDGRRGFRINGERVYLRGTNRHQEYPFVGYALSDEAHYRDAVKIKNAGFDMVRLSHYPHSEAFMRAADELGLVLMNAIPGWQFFGDADFQDHAIRDVRQLARRDRNHPSVAFWEVSLNESGMDDAFMERANDALRAEFPGQPVYTAGWIDHESYDVFIPARQHSRPPDYWSTYDKGDRPIFIAEYGDWEYYAHNAGFRQDEFEDLREDERTSRQLRGDGEKRLLQQALNYQEAANSNRKGSATVGDANWLMFDYNRGYADDLEASGISDLFRLPKFAYYFYRSQREPTEKLEPPLSSGPMVHIASYWLPSSNTKVRVFSNAEEVAVYLNDELVDRRHPDDDRMTSHLPHPPFTFDLGVFEPGTLRAIGYIGGVEVASHEVSTPGAASRLDLEIDYSGIPVAADEDDVLFVHAHVVDAAGQPVPEDQSEVHFEIRGNGRLVGQNPVRAEAGIASILVQTLSDGSPISLIARADGLDADSTQINR